MAGVEIQALADTAKKSIPYGLTPDKWIEVYNEKFAELIVRECDRYARSVWEHGELLGRDLLIHFGVEE